jgi:hypothetical protein
MNAIGWLLTGFGVLVVIGGAIAVYFLVPVWRCPECESYRIAEDGDSLSCLECGHEWVAR